MSGTLQRNDRRHVVIVGGGFAGVNVARRLEKRLDRDWEIYLLSEENYLTYKPLLPEVVGASILPSNVVAPLRQMTGRTRLRMVRVEGVDVRSKTVHYRGRAPGTLNYDELVLACGQRPRVDLIEGMDCYGNPLATVGDALHLRNRILARLEQATIEPDKATRDWLTRFVVVGGGFSGVEVAGEIFDFLCAAVRYYKNVSAQDCRVTLLHAGDRLLPELSPRLGEVAGKNFAKRGIEVRLDARAVGFDDDGVTLGDGLRISGGTVITTIGTEPQPFTANVDLPKERGRFLTGPDLAVDGVDGVWAVGDCALVPNARNGQYSPPTAQFAERQARVLADNLAARTAGRETRDFRYRPRGQLASIGHTKAVVELPGLRFSGFVAWLVWRAFYLVRIPTFARKARLYLEWTWAMFFPPDVAHMNFDRTGMASSAVERRSGTHEAQGERYERRYQGSAQA
ncbi:MAG: FAD-dependent oxidoreductase [Gammaproteobacteria bacterium]|jgi:NADH dehydrogenase|nr:FAD-dependent oxidoreductase [Gammaproteobacteria bacterium]